VANTAYASGSALRDTPLNHASFTRRVGSEAVAKKGRVDFVVWAVRVENRI